MDRSPATACWCSTAPPCWRQGDAVDAGGNGLFDDNAFLNALGNAEGVPTGTGELHFVATLRNAAGTTIGSGCFVVDTGPGDEVLFADGIEAP